MLWLDGGFVLRSCESDWSQDTGHLIVCLKVSVKIAVRDESNQTHCVFTGKVGPFCNSVKCCITFHRHSLGLLILARISSLTVYSYLIYCINNNNLFGHFSANANVLVLLW